jgi:16S rRNA processing protein RimM
MVDSEQDTHIIVGRIAGLFGVRGWVRIYSHTQPLDNILGYTPWLLLQGGRWVPVKHLDGRIHGKGIVAQLEGIDDRDAAAALIGCDIAIERSQLGRTAPDEVYWADLIGLKVVTLDGVELGVVDHLLETGANDVVVVQGERERLLPYVEQVIHEVDLAGGVLRVDWDPDF